MHHVRISKSQGSPVFSKMKLDAIAEHHEEASSWNALG